MPATFLPSRLRCRRCFAPTAPGNSDDIDQEIEDGDATVVAPANFNDSADPAEDGTYTALLGDLVDRMEAPLDGPRGVRRVHPRGHAPRPANFEEIIATNLGRRDVDDEKAFELELGPNNCAATRESMAND